MSEDSSAKTGKPGISLNLFWKLILLVFGIVTISCGLIRIPGFWTSYGVNIFGAAFAYVLIRAQYRAGEKTFLSIGFSPEGAVIFVIAICFIVETTQFLQIYRSVFDLNDYFAYFGGAVFSYFLDKVISLIFKKS